MSTDEVAKAGKLVASPHQPERPERDLPTWLESSADSATIAHLETQAREKLQAKLPHLPMYWEQLVASTTSTGPDLDSKLFELIHYPTELPVLKQLPALLQQFLTDLDSTSLSGAKVRLGKQTLHQDGGQVLQFIEELARRKNKADSSLLNRGKEYYDSQILTARDLAKAKARAIECLAAVEQLDQAELLIAFLEFQGLDRAAFERDQAQLQMIYGLQQALQKIEQNQTLGAAQRQACIAVLGLRAADSLSPTLFADMIEGADNPFSSEYVTELLKSYFSFNSPLPEIDPAQLKLLKTLDRWQLTKHLAFNVLLITAVGLAFPSLARAAMIELIIQPEVQATLAEMATNAELQQRFIPGLEAFLQTQQLHYEWNHDQPPAVDSLTPAEVAMKIERIKNLPPNPNYRPFDLIIQDGLEQYTAETSLQPFWQVDQAYEPISYYQDTIRYQAQADLINYLEHRTEHTDTEYPIMDIWQKYVPSNLIPQISRQQMPMNEMSDFSFGGLNSAFTTEAYKYRDTQKNLWENDLNELALSYFADLSEYVMTRSEQTGQPVPTSEVMTFLLKKNNGDVRKTLVTLSLWYRFLARNHNRYGATTARGLGGDATQGGFISTYILDQFSVGPSFNELAKLGGELYWDCARNEPTCNKNRDGANQEGLPYHLIAEAALLAVLPQPFVTDVTLGLEMSSVEEHGPQKVAAELAAHRRFPQLAALLEKYRQPSIRQDFATWANSRQEADTKVTLVPVTLTDAAHLVSNLGPYLSPKMFSLIQPADLRRLSQGNPIRLQHPDGEAIVLQLHHKRLGDHEKSVISYLSLTQGINPEVVQSVADTVVQVGVGAERTAQGYSFQSVMEFFVQPDLAESLSYYYSWLDSSANIGTKTEPSEAFLQEVLIGQQPMQAPVAERQVSLSEFQTLLTKTNTKAEIFDVTQNQRLEAKHFWFYADHYYLVVQSPLTNTPLIADEDSVPPEPSLTLWRFNSFKDIVTFTELMVDLQGNFSTTLAFEAILKTFKGEAVDPSAVWRLPPEPNQPAEAIPSAAWLTQHGIVLSTFDSDATTQPIPVMVQDHGPSLTSPLTYNAETDGFLIDQATPNLRQTAGFLFQHDGEWLVSLAHPTEAELSNPAARAALPADSILFRFAHEGQIDVSGLPISPDEVAELSHQIAYQGYAKITGTNGVSYMAMILNPSNDVKSVLGHTKLYKSYISRTTYINYEDNAVFSTHPNGELVLIPATGLLQKSQLENISEGNHPALSHLLDTLVNVAIKHEPSGDTHLLAVVDEANLFQFFRRTFDNYDMQGLWSGDQVVGLTQLYQAITTKTLPEGQPILIPYNSGVIRVIPLQAHTYAILTDTDQALFTNQTFEATLPSGMNWDQYLKFNFYARSSYDQLDVPTLEAKLDQIDPVFFHEEILANNADWSYLVNQFYIEDETLYQEVAKWLDTNQTQPLLRQFVFSRDQIRQMGYLWLRRQNGVATATVVASVHREWGDDFATEMARLTDFTDQFTLEQKNQWLDTSEYSKPATGIMQIGNAETSLSAILSLANSQTEPLAQAKATEWLSDLKRHYRVKVDDGSLLVGDPDRPADGFFIVYTPDEIDVLEKIDISSKLIKLFHLISVQGDQPTQLSESYYFDSTTEISNYLAQYGFEVTETEIAEMTTDGYKLFGVLIRDAAGLTGETRTLNVRESGNGYELIFEDSTLNQRNFFQTYWLTFKNILSVDQFPPAPPVIGKGG